jgi:hypothetical protein
MSEKPDTIETKPNHKPGTMAVINRTKQTMRNGTRCPLIFVSNRRFVRNTSSAVEITMTNSEKTNRKSLFLEKNKELAN